uniref:Pleckstrin homology-like domain, family B, member 2a n=1 Tax=Hucho hucho TaxID=62062 RepID=A0A4W5LIT1_9TELE
MADEHRYVLSIISLHMTRIEKDLPSTPTTPVTSPTLMWSAYQEQARRFYGSDRPPLSGKAAAPRSPSRRSDPTSSRTSMTRKQSYQSQDSLLISPGNGRRPLNPNSSPLLSMRNGGSSNSVAGGESLCSPPPSSLSPTSGAASMPSSPRLGLRSHGNHEPVPSNRTRKYSAGSIGGMMESHCRSLPRLCPSLSPRSHDNGALALVSLSLTSNPLRNSSHNNSQNHTTNNNYNHNQITNFNYSQAPPDVTTPSLSGGSSSPRVAKKLSLSSTSSLQEPKRPAIRGASPGPELFLGERGRDHRGGSLEPRLGLEERRQSFGKGGVGLGAGFTPPGGFRVRSGSISSLSGKEELTDYHHRQRDERLREQEVERLELQRLETILSLCSELGRSEQDREKGVGSSPGTGAGLADLQKINRELEKLQVSYDNEPVSVFFDLTVNGNGTGSENNYYGNNKERQVGQQGSGDHRDNRAESPVVSLRSSASSPIPRLPRTNQVRLLHFLTLSLSPLSVNLPVALSFSPFSQPPCRSLFLPFQSTSLSLSLSPRSVNLPVSLSFSPFSLSFSCTSFSQPPFLSLRHTDIRKVLLQPFLWL